MRTRRAVFCPGGALLLVLIVVTAGCNRRGGQALDDSDGPDLAAEADLLPAEDLSVAVDLLRQADLAAPDLAMSSDLAAPPDLATPPDLAMPPDLRMPDLAPPPDLATPDLRMPDLATAPDLRTRPPCLRGTGFAAFRFHYEAGSTSARLDAFGLPDNTNWQAVPAFATSVVDLANGGGINIAGGNWILIRFSLNGISRINGATLSIRGRSYSVGSSGSFEGWSPLYGSINSPVNSVSNAWPYSWTSVDYSANVRVGDAPGLTGIRLYARGNSNNLVINTVELCLDAS